MELDRLIDRYAYVKRQIDHLEREKKELTKMLEPYFVGGVGQILQSESGTKIRMDCRNMLNDDKLRERIGERRFARVSKRVSVSSLIRSAILRGTIDKSDIDQCMEPVTPWFRVIP